jgi:hypothetical protein
MTDKLTDKWNFRKTKTGIVMERKKPYYQSKFLYLKRNPTGDDISFLLEIFLAGKEEARSEIREKLGILR